MQAENPDVTFVHTGDRESDVFDFFELAQSDDVPCTPDGRRPHLLIRAAQDRRVLANSEDPQDQQVALLWETIEIKTLEDAIEKIRWYTRRWLIELLFKTLKSGCRIEDRQFETADRIKRCLPIDLVVAWRIVFMTYMGREYPNLPCTVIFEDDEWQALYCFVKQTTKLPAKPPTLSEATRMVASLGGFLGRKSDGEPGITVLWRGLQRLNDITRTWRLLRPIPKSQEKLMGKG